MFARKFSKSYEENVRVFEKAFQRADVWAKKHAAKFAPDKFELIHVTNPIAKQPVQDAVQPDQDIDI